MSIHNEAAFKLATGIKRKEKNGKLPGNRKVNRPSSVFGTAWKIQKT